MMHRFFTVLLTLGFLVSSGHVAASLMDVGVVSPERTLLYYKEGDYIFVKNCDSYTILGSTPKEARANCKGKTMRVPIDEFKQTLRDLVSTSRLNTLKPLTPAEIQDYVKNKNKSDQIEAMIRELDKMNSVIAAYGAENVNLARKEELVKSLQSKETAICAIAKINAEVEKAINLIADQTELALTKLSSDKDQFFFTTLNIYKHVGDKSQCGLSGSIDERIKDCSNYDTAKSGDFSLVTRTKGLKEVYRDNRTGVIWGDTFPSMMYKKRADEICDVASEEMGYLKNLKWQLPSIEEFKEVDLSKRLGILKDRKDTYWTRSNSNGNEKCVLHSYSKVWDCSHFAYFYEGEDGRGTRAPYNFLEGYSKRVSDYKFFARCVAL